MFLDLYNPCFPQEKVTLSLLGLESIFQCGEQKKSMRCTQRCMWKSEPSSVLRSLGLVQQDPVVKRKENCVIYDLLYSTMTFEWTDLLSSLVPVWDYWTFHRYLQSSHFTLAVSDSCIHRSVAHICSRVDVIFTFFKVYEWRTTLLLPTMLKE